MLALLGGRLEKASLGLWHLSWFLKEDQDLANCWSLRLIDLEEWEGY